MSFASRGDMYQVDEDGYVSEEVTEAAPGTTVYIELDDDVVDDKPAAPSTRIGTRAQACFQSQLHQKEKRRRRLYIFYGHLS
jgi:hypothetical protein